MTPPTGRGSATEGALRPGSFAALVAATPASRDRHADLVRLFAISAVVLGHWLAVVIVLRDGRLVGQNALALLPWAHWATWVFQVMPLFFLVGGYANAASWRSRRERGWNGAFWVRSRALRLLRPTTLFVAVVTVGAFVARVLGVDPRLVDAAAWAAGIALWFWSTCASSRSPPSITPPTSGGVRRCPPRSSPALPSSTWPTSGWGCRWWARSTSRWSGSACTSSVSLGGTAP